MADVVFMTGLLMRGSTHVIVPTFDPINVLKTMAAERITDCVLVPTMIQMLVDHPSRSAHDISSVRRMIYGASPIDESLLDRALEAFPQAAFFQGYGMTELSPLAAVLAPEFHSREHRASGKLRSAGRATLCAELRVLDEADQSVPAGTVGEIAVRSPCAMQGYLNKPEETAAALKNGWMHTGDGGYLDADGFLYVVDRLKDMIVTGGENVFSIEVENALLKHPSIAACAVIGVPDADWGERVHAVIVLRTGTETIELNVIREHARQYIASYKCPRSIEVRSTLPLSAAGKVLKKTLREPYWQGRTRRVS
jgi:acyl-CoA synthetase (AMP-forming)/AMP-acid ligase II